MEFRRTDGKNVDFIENCRLLDQVLEQRVGKELQQNQYHVHNQLDKIHEAIVVYQNGCPIGGGAFRSIDSETAELKRIFVQPDWQGQGVGKELVSRLIAWASELGYKKLILESAKPLSEAHALYRKLGFEMIPNYGPYVAMEESLCMAKELTP